MSTYAAKPSSLIERKKQQWARERVELAGLSAPWGFVNTPDSISSEHVAKLATPTPNADIFLRRESTASRRQSLPPIYKKQILSSYPHNERYDKEMGGETSGYGSDNPNKTPEYFPQTTWNQNLGYESSSSARDDRAKWGERGGVAKYWNSQEVNCLNKMDNTPGWVKRGLQEGTELIVSTTSPAESPEQDYGDQQRPYTSSSISQTRTYIRGQNNPVDPVELAQREIKRQVARIHQEAIKQQLEEREQKRKEERERQIREEREEELRIEREQEIERQRREREQLIILKKQEQERKRKEALAEAIKLAEKAALEQKKQKLTRQVLNINISENFLEKEKVISPRPISISNNNNNNNNNEEDNKNNTNKVCNNNKTELEPDVSNNNVPNNNLNEKIENDLTSNMSASESSSFATPQHQQEASSSKLKLTNTENVPRIIQTPFDGYANFPFAILMPTFAAGPSGASMALPMQVNTETRSSTPHQRTENRVLTPTLYRQRRFCDSSTQTDKLENDQGRELKLMKEKLNNLELSDETRTKTESKGRTGEKVREHSSDRPKWGANRPPTRYIKQSEKDPFYQRKKFRQKIRQIKIFDDKNNNYSAHSSDDSQIASPRSYRKKGYIEKRRTRALWQKNGHLFSRNMQVYQTEIIPLESDSNTIYYKKPNCVKCCCDCRSNHHKYKEELKVVDILKIEHTPRGDDNSLPDCNIPNVNQEILEKLNSLHNGLMTKQEQWENSPLTPSLSSPNRITEVNP